MKTYYRLTVNTDMRYAGRNSRGWFGGGGYSKTFDTPEQAREYINKEWQNCKNKQPIYLDSSEGTRKIGTLFKYKEKNQNGETIYKHDYMTVSEIKSTYILV